MDKYAEQLSLLPNDFLHIARSFAVDNSSPKVEPAHILRALLHKSAGLVDFIENTLDSDYYYLLDWTDIRMGQAPKSAYPMKDFVLSDEARSVVREAMTTSRSLGSETLDIRALLAAVVTPGVGFSADQLKTMPLSHTAVLAAIGGNAPAPAGTAPAGTTAAAAAGANPYYTVLTDEEPDHTIVGFDLIPLSQGVSYKSEIEDRFKKLSDELLRHPQTLLVIENFHRVMDRQSTLNGILAQLKRLLSKTPCRWCSPRRSTDSPRTSRKTRN